MNAFEIYNGSDGKATTALYEHLQLLGAKGIIALNLFRAQKCSERAKGYRSQFKGDAYQRKTWSMRNLCVELEKSASYLGFEWGWKIDPKQEVHRWVLYVVIPTGQVSFHSAERLHAKDFPGDWDGQHVSAERIIRWTQQILEGKA